MNKPPKNLKNPELTIIILTYNNESQLPNCLDSLYKFYPQEFASGKWEIIVIDNSSSDKTIENLNKNKNNYPGLSVLINYENVGFGPGNNIAAKKAKGDYILFLNADTIVENNAIEIPLQYLKDHLDTGIVTAKLLLGNGKLDTTCHRAFPTPLNALFYFSGLSAIFPKSKLFAGYILGDKDPNTTHEVDAVTGAYLMIPRSLGEKLSWFDEQFFWKGEDLDLCYRVKQAGYKIIYLHNAVVHHLKGSSGGHKRGTKSLKARFEVMQLFYQKHYNKKYPVLVQQLVFLGIKFRYLIAYFTGK